MASTPSDASEAVDFSLARAFYARAAASGVIGRSDAEVCGRVSEGGWSWTLMKTTIPSRVMTLQFMWTFFIILVDQLVSSSSWGGRLLDAAEIPTEVLNAFSWGLFALLAFHVSIAIHAFQHAFQTYHLLRAHLHSLLRHLRYLFANPDAPEGRGRGEEQEQERRKMHLICAAYVCAYPIAVKMHMRDERDVSQLAPLLGNLEATRLIQQQRLNNTPLFLSLFHTLNAHVAATASSHATTSSRRGAVERLCSLLMEHSHNLTIKKHASSFAYTASLLVFLFIWLFFLPLNLLPQCGPLLTLPLVLLLTYFVATLFSISHAILHPFSNNPLHVPLTKLLANLSKDLLDLLAEPLPNPLQHSSSSSSSPFLASPQQHLLHAQPQYARAHAVLHPPSVSSSHPSQTPLQNATRTLRHLRRALSNPVLLSSLLFYTIYIIVLCIITYIYSLTSTTSSQKVCLHWCVHVPITSDVLSYISLGLFLVLPFWLSDAYDHYRKGLFLFHVQLPTRLEALAHAFASIPQRDVTWHPGDRERIFSLLAAVPVVSRLCLQRRDDFEELNQVLETHDLEHVKTCEQPITYLFSQLVAYVHTSTTVSSNASSASPLILFGGGHAKEEHETFGNAAHAIHDLLHELERTVLSCRALQQVQVPQAYSQHLRLFLLFWLLCLPFVTIAQLGWFSPLVLTPIAYSVLALYHLGIRLFDPFHGNEVDDQHQEDDEVDVPLSRLCQEMLDSLRRIYHDNLQEPLQDKEAIEASQQPDHYTVEKFLPKPCRKDVWNDEMRYSETPTFKRTLRQVLHHLPSIPATPFILTSMWMIGLVTLSNVLSRVLWNDERQSLCRFWCSPIDLDGGTLHNLGYALFAILSFRATDAVHRYEHGAALLYTLAKDARNLAVELCVLSSNADEDSEEAKGKLRIVAHLAQLPLCLRDVLLNVSRSHDLSDKEGLLSDTDWEKLLSHASPIQYLLQEVEKHVLHLNLTTTDDKSQPLAPGTDRLLMYERVTRMRETLAEVFCIKRFPVVSAYVDHQRLFTMFWLLLLPLGMTASVGWWTALWAPVIAYGVFSLELIARKLVDPFGTDDIDIPVEEICSNAANDLMEAVCACNYGNEYLTTTSEDNSHHHRSSTLSAASASSSAVGVVLDGTQLRDKFSVAQLDEDDEGSTGQVRLAISGPVHKRVRYTLYSHVVHSVPWGPLGIVFVWGVFATALSYVSRRTNPEEIVDRWWTSSISVSDSVAGYVSFGATFLLGLYVNLAYARYREAGTIWFAQLPGACHELSMLWMTLFKKNSWHAGDQNRVLAHIAAIPLVLKHTIRHTRDIRELKGLLSATDLARLQLSSNMAWHCLDVVRSYYFKLNTDEGRWRSRGPELDPNRMSFVGPELKRVEDAVTKAMYLRDFAFAQGFKSVLDTMLSIWLLLLPFVLAENSGWFTIVWMPVIAFAVLGMYHVADELQQPFGDDVNDLDLDFLADSIVQDVLFVHRSYKDGLGTFIDRDAQAVVRQDVPNEGVGDDEGGQREKSIVDKVLHMAMRAVATVDMALLIGWAMFVCLISYVLTQFTSSSSSSSILIVDPDIQSYIGVVMFFLLAFQLTDSHARYYDALSTAHEKLTGTTTLLGLQFMSAFPKDVFHMHDRERCLGFIRAYVHQLTASLQGKRAGQGLWESVGAVDAGRVERAGSPVFFCVDVVRAYVVEGEQLLRKKSDGLQHRVCNMWMSAELVDKLTDAGRKLLALRHVPMPFGYVTHLRLFLILWLGLLPMGLVEIAGGMAVVWSVVIATGVMGIAHWSRKLADPFGKDETDIPLQQVCRKNDRNIAAAVVVMRDGLDAMLQHQVDVLPKHFEPSGSGGVEEEVQDVEEVQEVEDEEQGLLEEIATDEVVEPTTYGSVDE